MPAVPVVAQPPGAGTAILQTSSLLQASPQGPQTSPVTPIISAPGGSSTNLPTNVAILQGQPLSPAESRFFTSPDTIRANGLQKTTFKWKQSEVKLTNPNAKSFEPRINIPDFNSKTPAEAFLASLPYEFIIRVIIPETNHVGIAKYQQNWTMLNYHEFVIYLAIGLAIAMVDFGSREKYWSATLPTTRHVFDGPKLGRFMSMARWNQIEHVLTLFLRDAPMDDKLRDTRSMYEAFNEHNSIVFSPGMCELLTYEVGTLSSFKLVICNLMVQFFRLAQLLGRKHDGVVGKVFVEKFHVGRSKAASCWSRMSYFLLCSKRRTLSH